MAFLTSFLNACPGAIGQGLIWGIMAIGVYVTFRILDVADLTVDGSLATGGVVCVMLLRANCNVWLAMLIAFIAGALAGLVTGLLHTKMGIPAILAGILTQLSLYSVNLWIMGFKANQPVSVDKYNLLVSQRYVRNFKDLSETLAGMEGGKFKYVVGLIFQNPIIVSLLFTVILIAALYCFFGTEKGCSLRATGCNEGMAKAQGINTDNNKILGLAISNGIVAVSGAFIAQYQGSSDINMGRGAIVIGLAAVIISEVVFGKIFRNLGLKLFAVSIGAVIYYIVIQFVLQLGLRTDFLKLLSAAVVALFLGIPYWKGKLPKRKKAV